VFEKIKGKKKESKGEIPISQNSTPVHGFLYSSSSKTVTLSVYYIHFVLSRFFLPLLTMQVTKHSLRTLLLSLLLFTLSPSHQHHLWPGLVATDDGSSPA